MIWDSKTSGTEEDLHWVCVEWLWRRLLRNPAEDAYLLVVDDVPARWGYCAMWCRAAPNLLVEDISDLSLEDSTASVQTAMTVPAPVPEPLKPRMMDYLETGVALWVAVETAIFEQRLQWDQAMREQAAAKREAEKAKREANKAKRMAAQANRPSKKVKVKAAKPSAPEKTKRTREEETPLLVGVETEAEEGDEEEEDEEEEHEVDQESGDDDEQAGGGAADAPGGGQGEGEGEGAAGGGGGGGGQEGAPAQSRKRRREEEEEEDEPEEEEAQRAAETVEAVVDVEAEPEYLSDIEELHPPPSPKRTPKPPRKKAPGLPAPPRPGAGKRPIPPVLRKPVKDPQKEKQRQATLKEMEHRYPAHVSEDTPGASASSRDDSLVPFSPKQRQKAPTEASHSTAAGQFTAEQGLKSKLDKFSLFGSGGKR